MYHYSWICCQFSPCNQYMRFSIALYPFQVNLHGLIKLNKVNLNIHVANGIHLVSLDLEDLGAMPGSPGDLRKNALAALLESRENLGIRLGNRKFLAEWVTAIFHLLFLRLHPLSSEWLLLAY